jgi:hypothetical protein
LFSKILVIWQIKESARKNLNFFDILIAIVLNIDFDEVKDSPAAILCNFTFGVDR